MRGLVRMRPRAGPEPRASRSGCRQQVDTVEAIGRSRRPGRAAPGHGRGRANVRRRGGCASNRCPRAARARVPVRRHRAIALTREIEAERRAIYLIDVGAMRRPEERRVAGALSGERVARGIVREVCFGFDDAPGHQPFAAAPHEHASKERASQRLRPVRKFACRKPAMGLHAATRSATSARARCARSPNVPRAKRASSN